MQLEVSVAQALVHFSVVKITAYAELSLVQALVSAEQP
jgi:hypothetical protein